jgi:hypothetical protein
MRHSHAEVGLLQLEDYVRLVPQIYGAHDQNRSIWDVWCHTLHHGAAVAERIRKEVPADKLFTEVADFSLWLFTAVQKLSGGLGRRKTIAETPIETLIRIESSCSDLIWHRYPGVCHVCHARRRGRGITSRSGLLRPCDCFHQTPDRRGKDEKRADSRLLRQFSEANQGRKPKTIDAWQQMFASIYGANIKRLSTAEIGFHLMEELGEASDALVRMYSYTVSDFRTGEPNWRQARLEGQIADTFSWLFSLVDKLSETKPITLSQVIWRRYGSDRLNSFRCPVCDKPRCSCPLLFIPATRPTADLLEKYQRRRRGKRV